MYVNKIIGLRKNYSKDQYQCSLFIYRVIKYKFTLTAYATQ
jgi:hypothetical protein